MKLNISKILLQEKKFVIEINLKRRQLKNFQIAELAYKIEEIESEKARLRSYQKLKDVKEKSPPLSSSEDNGETGKVVDN